MRFFIFLLAAAFAALSCVPAPCSARALPEKIERAAVAGVLPFPSVLCLYLGSAEKIIAIPPASMSAAREGLLGELFPGVLKAETSFASGTGANIEELLTLRPDVVFYLEADKVTGRALENAGLAGVPVSPSKWGYDVLRTYEEWIKTLAAIFPERAEAGEKAVAYGRRALELTKARAALIPQSERKKVLFIVRDENGRIVTSGRNFFGQYWCESIGAENAAAEITAERSNAVVTMEQIYKWNPDVIFITNFTKLAPRDLLSAPEWRPVEAVRRGAVYKMPLALYRTYTPGPDAPLTLLWLARAVYPETFGDIDLPKQAAKYYKEIFGLDVSAERAREIFAAPQSGGSGR